MGKRQGCRLVEPSETLPWHRGLLAGPAPALLTRILGAEFLGRQAEEDYVPSVLHVDS